MSTKRGGGQLPGNRRRKSARVSFGGHAEESRETARAYVVHVELKSRDSGKTPPIRSAADKLQEALGLAGAIGLVIAGKEIVTLAAPRPATLIGKGKVEELAGKIAESEAGLVIFNTQLAPIQQSNLEKALKAKVLDRTGLILEIFGERASTREGVLQVELAHLQYQKGRLVRSWTHLERQRGGFGFLGGPGESQIESDRRLIQERISKLERELAQVARRREQQRKGRARTPFPVVSLVGYTNAGKSTLFNRLTHANVLAQDLLFATLDPTMRVITLPHGRKIVLSDTVGFISDLPTTLVAAFRATLEEVLQADVILHIRDISHPETDAQCADVYGVLDQLGLSEGKRNHVIEVWNKSDRLDPLDFASREALAGRRQDCVLASAASGEGIQRMLELVEAKLARSGSAYTLTLDPADGKGLAWCHERAEVLQRKELASGKIRLKLRLTPDLAGLAEHRFGRALRRITTRR